MTRTVLVVDDEESLRLLVQMTLARGAYRTVLAMDGEEGLRLAREEHPDLVILDVGLPGINGIEVCRQLRADPATRDAKIVIVSAWTAPEHRAAGLAAGADDYLPKPFKPLEFLAYLDRLFAD